VRDVFELYIKKSLKNVFIKLEYSSYHSLDGTSWWKSATGACRAVLYP